MTTESIRSPASVENLDRVLAFLTGRMRSEGFADREIMQAELAAEEIFVNICDYSGLSPEEEIAIRAISEPDRIRVEFADRGARFNPLLVSEADTTSPAEERAIGGLGIHMIRNLTDEVTYEYVDGANVLSFIKLREFAAD